MSPVIGGALFQLIVLSLHVLATENTVPASFDASVTKRRSRAELTLPEIPLTWKRT